MADLALAEHSYINVNPSWEGAGVGKRTPKFVVAQCCRCCKLKLQQMALRRDISRASS